jgi:hypothetical protein
MAQLSKPFTPQHTRVKQEKSPTIGGFQVTPAGIEFNPLGFGEGACNYILKGLVLSGRVLQGLVLARAND